MNIRTENLVRRFRKTYGDPESVLEVGSLCVGSTPGRKLWPNSQYLGIDLVSGPNVDQVVPEDWRMGRTFSVVCAWGTLEHTQRLWNTFENMADHLQPGGFLLATTPWVFPHHPYPRDCWRISPDGYRSLCEYSGLKVIETRFDRCRLWGERTIGGLLCNLWVRIRYGMIPCESYCIAKRERYE